MQNCLSHSLQFWGKNRNYNLFYNSNHVVAVDANEIVGISSHWIPITDFGIQYFLSSHPIDSKDKELLIEYFKLKK